MTALALTITTAGLGRFTSAQAGDDIDLTVAQVGVTASDFVAAPTLTRLPGEIKKLGTVSGEALPNSIVHMTIRDQSADTYSVRGFGLYLADGTLFAVYGQPAVIVEKSVASTILLALDIKFPSGDVGAITFGDANFSYPPASETRIGVAEIATQGEVDDGSDDARFVTPKKLKQRLAGISAGLGNAATAARKILTSGLATGGGDLTADRTIDVPIAQGSEIVEATNNSKAMTPLGFSFWQTTRKILTSGLATGGGHLGGDRTIDVPAASAAETDAGSIGNKAVTPASLVNVLSSIAARALNSRQIGAGGLATGGGDLTADRTITVPKASAADVLAGSDDTRAVTSAALGNLGHLHASGGYQVLPGGLILQWGGCSHSAGGAAAVVFPIAFPNAAYGALATNNANGPPTAWPGVGAITTTGMTVYAASSTGQGPAAAGVASIWFAWGK